MSEAALELASACEPDKPFRLIELTSLCGIIENSPQRKMPLPSTHPVYSRLKATLECRKPSSCEFEMTAKVVIELLASLSSARENLGSCNALLTDVGSIVEAFVSRHLRPNGHGFDDDVIGALLYAMFRLAPSASLCAHDVLDLVQGKLFAAIAAVSAALQLFSRRFPVVEMLQSPTWEDETSFFVAAVRVTYELSTARTFFECIRGTADTDQSIARLDKEYRVFLGVLNRAVMEVPLLDVITAVLGSWFDVLSEPADLNAVHLLPFFQEALCRTLMLIGNMLCITNEYSAQLKRFLSQRTSIVQHVAIPYLVFALDIIERQAFDPEDFTTRYIVPFLEVIKVVALLTYKIKVCRPFLSQHPLLGARLIDNEVLWSSSCRVEYFCLVTRLLINAEMNDSVQHVLRRHSMLTAAEKAQVAYRLTARKEVLYPVEVTCATYKALQSIFSASNAAAVSVPDSDEIAAPPPPTTASEFVFHYEGPKEERTRRRTSRRNRHWQRDTQRRRYGAIRIRKKGLQEPSVARVDEVDRGCEGDEDVSSDDVMMEVVDVSRGSQKVLQRNCERNNTSPKEATGTQEEDHRSTWQQYTVPCSNAARETETPPVSENVTWEDVEKEEEEPVNPGIDLSKWRKEAPKGVPFQYLCALSSQLIRVPVIAPNGDVFDRQTILAFLKEHPRTHPLTSDELYPSDLVIDQRLQREIDAVRNNYVII